MPFHARNLAWYGNPLGEHRWEDGGDQIISSWHPALLASNVMRHATLHLLGPWPEVNQQLLRAVNAWHDWAGVDVNDRRTTLWTLTFDPEYAPDVETSAGAPARPIFNCYYHRHNAQEEHRLLQSCRPRLPFKHTAE